MIDYKTKEIYERHFIATYKSMKERLENVKKRIEENERIIGN